MKVILLKELKGKGGEGDVIDVAPGFANNYLLTQGYATPQERHILNEMFLNYKAHGWNGDMDARLKKVYALRTDHAE